jgi:hypothetical protein
MLAYNLHVCGPYNDNTHTDFENKYHLVYNYHELDIVVQGESILEKIINIAFFIL